MFEKMAGALKRPVLEEFDFAESTQCSEVLAIGENVFFDLGFPRAS